MFAYQQPTRASIPGPASRANPRIAWIPGAILAFAILTGCESSTHKTAVPTAPPPVTVSQPLQQDVTEFIEYTGNTQAIYNVEVRAKVKGFLKSIEFQARAKVKENDHLFIIDPRPFEVALQQAQSLLAARKADQKFQEFDKKRIEDLKENATDRERAESISKLDAAVAAVAEAEASVAEAELNLDYAHVKSPISGRISRNMVDVGNLINAGENLLATITYDDYVYAYFNVSEQDVLRLRRMYGSPKVSAEKIPTTRPADRAPVHLGLMDEKNYPHEGWVDYVNTTLDPTTGTISIRAVFPNPDGILIPGLFTRIRIPIGKPKQALLVSERALGFDQGQRYLLAVNDKNTVEYKRVQIGILQEGLRVIENGIGPDDWVIVNGLQCVRPGMPVVPQRTAMPTSQTAATKPSISVNVKPQH